MSKKVLTGYVHRLVDGNLETAASGDPVPDWVTNPAVIGDPTPTEEAVEPTPTPADEKTTADLTHAELKKLAGELGIAKSGSKSDLIARITAASQPEQDVTDGRDALVEKAKAAGVENADELTDVELEAVIEASE